MLFSRADKGEFRELWGPSLEAARAAEVAADKQRQAAETDSSERQQKSENADSARQAVADRLLTAMGAEAVMLKVAERGFLVPNSPKIAALILAADASKN